MAKIKMILDLSLMLIMLLCFSMVGISILSKEMYKRELYERYTRDDTVYQLLCKEDSLYSDSTRILFDSLDKDIKGYVLLRDKMLRLENSLGYGWAYSVRRIKGVPLYEYYLLIFIMVSICIMIIGKIWKID